MSVFYTYSDDMEKEKMKFLEVLYHDRRGGQMIRLRKDGNEVSQISTCDLDELARTGTDDSSYYTTINTFKGNRRTSKSVFNCTSIFIDLDCHSDDPETVIDSKNRAVEILEGAFSSGTLPVPTLITDSGRGYGIQYVLKHSISRSGNTDVVYGLFKKVQTELFKKYSEILSSDPDAAQIDTSVSDDSRVCRIPGTYNSAAGKHCRLISVTEKYYDLSEIVRGANLWDWKTDEEYLKEKEERLKKRRESTRKKIVSFNEYRFPFLTARIEQLERLVDLRGGNMDGYREQLLFVGYSSLVQLDYTTAAKKLMEMNERFTDPLPKEELDHIIQGTNRNVGTDHRGFYKLPNSYLISTLGISEEEKKSIGLGMGGKRTAERQAARTKKREIREKVIGLLTQPDRLTYDEISAATGVSKRTVYSISKEEGLSRYKKSSVNNKIIDINSIKNGSTQKGKNAKNATGSCCAPSARGFDWEGFLFSLSGSFGAELRAEFRWAYSSYFSRHCSRALVRFFSSALFKFSSGLISATDICLGAAQILYRDFGSLDEARIFFGLFNVRSELSTLWDLVTQASLAATSSAVSEVPSHSDESYSDNRFDLITENLSLSGLDSCVLDQIRTVFAQVRHIRKDVIYIQHRPVLTSDVRKVFDNLTVSEISDFCRRFSHGAVLDRVGNVFTYVLSRVWLFHRSKRREWKKRSV